MRQDPEFLNAPSLYDVCMPVLNRREFLFTSAQLAASTRQEPAPKPRVGLVPSTHRNLARPSPVEDQLDYERVRDMVWKAIEYAPPRAGSLEAKIRRGSWVVIKPNIVFLRPQPSYRPGDVTDLRVTKAVLEYVARKSGAARITVAEGGSYRGLHDKEQGQKVTQNGARVNALTFDWGGEFPGLPGTLGGVLADLGKQFPDRTFDYVDLSYDAVRDASGAFRRVEVPRGANGVGAFGARPDYFVTNTIRNCDFLISVPVMKIHAQCGITCCLKNYVGTAPRQAYADKSSFSNSGLHDQHSAGGRIDPFIVDLAAFHPPDYCVVDGILGLQHQEHNNHRPDQTVRGNLVLASEDPVAADSVAAYLIGHNPWDMEFLHMAQRRGMGTMDLGKLDIAGEEPDRLRRPWGKPRGWYGRCNREWLLTRDAASDIRSWKPHTAPFDTLDLAAWSPAAADATYGAAVRVQSEGHRKAFLWLGLRGRGTVQLNGETITTEENRTRYRVGQFQKPVELRAGENLLVCRVQPFEGQALLSVLLVGPHNDGDTVDGIRWLNA